MTLIISKASINYILQVSDRLVTMDQKPFDPLSNKSIIYCALNGILSISYTGVAFIGSLPTDQWIAEKLLGHSFQEVKKPPAFGNRETNFKYIGPALQMLRESLNNVIHSEIKPELRNDWFEKSFDLCIDGWVWGSKGKYRPFLTCISKPPKSHTFEYKIEPRRWYLGGRFKVGAAPSGNISGDILQSLVNKLANNKPDEAEVNLVSTIREVSKSNRLVGADCMSILLPPPPIAHQIPARVRFIPSKDATAILTSNSGKRIVKVAYTPWLIGPGSFSSPAIISGKGWEVGLCYYRIAFDGPEDPNVVGIFNALERPQF